MSHNPFPRSQMVCYHQGQWISIPDEVCAVPGQDKTTLFKTILRS
jgi:hypothetical protein